VHLCIPHDAGKAAAEAAVRWRADPASAASGNKVVGEELQPEKIVEQVRAVRNKN
jgi:hypothetical protein